MKIFLIKQLANIARIIREGFFKLSLFKRMFIGTVLVVALIISFLSIVNYRLSIDAYINEASKNTEFVVETINEYIEENIRQVDNITSFFYLKEERAEVIDLDNEDNIKEDYYNLKEMSGFFTQLLFLNDEINNFYLYILDGRDYNYFQLGLANPGYSPLNEEWFRSTLEMDGKLLVIPPHIPYQVKSDEEVFSYVRALKGTDNIIKAVLLVDIPVKHLKEEIESLMLYDDTKVIILSNNDEIIYDEYQIETIIEKKELLQNVSGSNHGRFNVDLEGESCLVTYSICEDTEWKIMLLTPYEYFNKNTRKLLNTFIYAIIFSLLIASIFSYIISKYAYRTMKKLKEGFEQVKAGNFNYLIKTKYDDELSLMLDDFNKMVKKTSNLIRINYEEKTARSEAEFRYLQAQINPHFIFNSLQIISSMAIVKDANEIDIAAKSLASVIKYSINVKSKTVPFKEELNNVKSYIEIQKLRFFDFITFEINVDEKVLNCIVVKLVLQPLIENSIEHGIRPKESHGLIKLTAHYIKDRLLVEVFDNGVGISDYEINKLMKYINNNDSETIDFKSNHNSVGLKNINKRLKIMYGKESGLRFESEEGMWTKVKFSIPARMELTAYE